MSIYVNGVDLGGDGWRVLRHRGLDAAPTVEYPSTTLPGLGLDVETDTVGRAAPRRFSITWGTKATSYAALDTALRTLKARLVGAPVVLTMDRRPNQRLTARVTDFPVVNGIGGQEIAPYWLEAEVSFVALDPYFEDTSEQAVSFGTTATALPQGTAATRGVLLLTASGGSVVNPTLTYKTAAGVTVASLAATITIASGDAFEVDVARATVRKRVSGVWTNAASTLAVGFQYPVFSPRDGTFLTSSWPTIQVAATSGGANANGTATYRRKWS